MLTNCNKIIAFLCLYRFLMPYQHLRRCKRYVLLCQMCRLTIAGHDIAAQLMLVLRSSASLFQSMA